MKIHLASLLARKYLASSVPLEIRQFFDNAYVENRVLVIQCTSKKHASQTRDLTYRTLLYIVESAPAQTINLTSVKYEWVEDGQTEAWSLPLFFLDQRGTMSLPTLSDYEILQEIHNHATATGLPASCLSMLDSKPLFASDNVDRSCGVPKADFLRLINPELYFPVFELAIYKDAIIAGNGESVDLPYVAANVNDRQLCERRVVARLVKTTWGEVVRLCKVTELPRPLGRTI